MHLELRMSPQGKGLAQKLQLILDQDKLEALGSLLDIESKGLALELSDGQAIYGGIVVRKDQESLEINQLALDASLRGQGLGKQMLTFIENWSRAEGVLTIRLSVLSYQNKDFFTHLGYINYSTLKDVPRRGVDSHYFIKYLD